MTDTDTTAAAPASNGHDPGAYTEEVWAYAGARVNSSHAKVSAWITPTGELRLFSPKGDAHRPIGGRYALSIRRDAGHIYRSGEPRYTGERQPDPVLTARWELADLDARRQLADRAAERSDAKRSELAAALEPLRELAGHCRTSAELDALLLSAQRTIYGAYGSRGR